MYPLLRKTQRCISVGQSVCQTLEQELRKSTNWEVEKNVCWSGNRSSGRRLLWCCPLISVRFNLCSIELGAFMLFINCAVYRHLCIISSPCGPLWPVLSIYIEHPLIKWISNELYGQSHFLGVYRHKYPYVAHGCGVLLPVSFLVFKNFESHMV